MYKEDVDNFWCVCSDRKINKFVKCDRMGIKYGGPVLERWGCQKSGKPCLAYVEERLLRKDENGLPVNPINEFYEQGMCLVFSDKEKKEDMYELLKERLVWKNKIKG